MAHLRSPARSPGAVVRCHPEDAPLLREHAGARAEAITGRLVEVAVRPTEGMARGACIVDFEDGLVDAVGGFSLSASRRRSVPL